MGGALFKIPFYFIRRLESAMETAMEELVIDDEKKEEEALLKKEEQEQIEQLDDMVTSHKKTIEDLKVDLYKRNAALQNVYHTNKFLILQLKEMNDELKKLAKYKGNYYDRNLEYANNLRDLEEIEKSTVTVFGFRRKKEEKRKETIQNLKDRLKLNIEKHVSYKGEKKIRMRSKKKKKSAIPIDI